MVWQLEEFQSEGDKSWHCNCIKALGTPHMAEWYIPARILEISPAEYVEYMIDNFKPDHIYVNKEKCLIFFSWNKQADMRKYKNTLNRIAREKNFQI